ncbi:DUF356 domain-containing protein [Methanohalobium sp.]|uniref:DUF356 domain-containing protein n=1 Tax=Methanohalobium sp. TaxID=2837493 RepID=UPI0025E2E061|nr:DUF356 domain-containing protein [Methanohalobium sp.]
MKSFAVIRGDNTDKVKIALHDLEQYGKFQFQAKPKQIEPDYADHLLVSVLRVPLKARCKSAALVELDDNAGAVISRLKKIHPPAHIVIVSPRHEAYNELINKSKNYPVFDRGFNNKRESKPMNM